MAKCFNGGLEDFRKRAKTSEITTLQPYLRPAEKASKWLPSTDVQQVLLLSRELFPWGCQAEEKLEPAPKPACRSCASLPLQGQLSVPGPTFKSSPWKPFTGAFFDILLGYHALLVHSQRTHQLQLIPSESFLTTHLMPVISRSHRKIWKSVIKLFFF